jgi:hypothetical protein
MSVLAAVFFSIDGMRTWAGPVKTYLSRPIGPAGRVWETWWRASDRSRESGEKLKRRVEMMSQRIYRPIGKVRLDLSRFFTLPGRRIT